MPLGRPDTYDEDKAASICEHVEKNGSISAAAREVGVARSTVDRWTENHPDFADAIARAKEAGYAERAEKAVVDAKAAEDAGLGRLAFDAERWYLSKIDPRRYGDKLDVTSGDKPIQQDTSDIAARAAALMALAAERKNGGK